MIDTQTIERIRHVRSLFDELTAMSFYGFAMRQVLLENQKAREACETLLGELRKDNVLKGANTAR